MNWVLRRLLTSTATVALAAFHPVAHAQSPQSPQSPTVAAGSISVSRQGATTVVTQTTTRGIIDWRSFSIAPQNAVRFDQPGTSAVTLNRVTGAEATRIDGSLSANGQVWITNPNGVAIGPGGQVNVGGLLATTGRVNQQEFLGAGRAKIDQIAKDAAVVNAGAITIGEGGYAALAAAAVRNEGVIAARSGSVALGSGKAMTLDFAGDRLIQYQVTQPLDQAPAGASALVENSGAIRAGSVLLSARAAKGVMDSVVNMTGVIVSNAVRVDGGTVVFGDGGAVNVSGRIDAGNASGAGGSVSVLGEKVGLMDGAAINASGSTGGGTVLVGGDWQGGGAIGAAGQNARFAYVAPTATVNVDATANGAGGKVVIWADDSTRFNGAISARGGNLGGDGGRVETSGKRALSVGPIASVTTANRAGGARAGAWLLDPSDINIQTGGLGTLSGGIYDPLTAFGQIDPVTINNGLLTGDVTIQTSSGTGGAGNINFTSGSIVYTGATARTLKLLADRDISFSSGVKILLSNAAHNVILNSGAGASVQSAVAGQISLNGATITTTGGNISLVGGQNGTLAAQGAAAGFNGVGIFGGSVMDAGNGSITIRGQGKPGDASSFVNGISIGTSSIAANGGITMTGVGGDASTSTGFGVILTATSITATGGVVSLAGIGKGVANTGGVSISQSTISYGGGSLAFTGTSNGGGTLNGGLFLGTTSITGGGAITFTGTGGAGTSGSNPGVSINQSTLTVGGAATMTGAGGGSATSSFDNGVVLNASTVQAGAGLTLTGTRGAGRNSPNIQLFSGSTLSATGGNILLSANAASGGGSLSFSHGVAIQDSALKTDTGSVLINGVGATAAAQSDGVSIGGSTALISVTGGNLTVTGQRGGGAQSNNVAVFSAATVSTVAGSLTIAGTSTTGGAGSFNHGVTLSSTSLITTSTGTITISGRGAASGSTNFGLFLNGTITATGASGAVQLETWGGGDSNADIYLNGSSRVSYTDATNTAAMKILAGRDVNVLSGASISFAGANNLVLNSGLSATNQASVDGSIRVNGNLTTTGGTITMGAGSGASLAAQQTSNLTLHAGVAVNSAVINAGAGAIIIRGNGGSADTNSVVNGVLLFSSSLIGGGGITLIGTGGSAATGDGVASPAGAGVNVNNTGLTATGAGSISITGTSSAVAADQRGVTIQAGANINLGTGTLTITGNGGSTTYGRGVFFSTATVTGSGPMVITGIAGQGSNPNPNSSSPHGVSVFNSSITGTGAASITINGTRGLTSTTLTARNVTIDTSTISTVSGNLSLIGTSTFGGSSVSASHGVDLRGGALLTTANGTISLNGRGALVGEQNVGIRLGGGPSSSTITATGPNGAIILNGVAGADPTTPSGLSADGSTLSTVGGSISINGTGAMRQPGPVITPVLILNGASANYVLTSSSNSVGTLAANVGSLTFVESSATSLIIGSVSGVSGVTAAGSLSLTGAQALTLNLPVTGSNVTLSTNGTISGSGPVVASNAPLNLAANGGDISVTVNGNTGPVAAGFVSMLAGFLSVNGVSLVYTPPSVVAAVTTPAAVTSPSVASGPSVATVETVAAAPTIASVATVPSQPSVATVASAPTLASQPTQSAVVAILQAIVGGTGDPSRIISQIVQPRVNFDLSPTAADPVAPVAAAGPVASAGPSASVQPARQSAVVSASAAAAAVSATPVGALIPQSAPSVQSTGAPLLSTPTIKVDAADTGGTSGQVVASAGAGLAGGQANSSVVPGLVSYNPTPTPRPGPQGEPPLAQLPPQINEEMLLD